MKRLRRWIASVLLAVVVLLPLPGCAGGQNPMSSIAGLALAVGASVGSYFLIKELE